MRLNSTNLLLSLYLLLLIAVALTAGGCTTQKHTTAFSSTATSETEQRLRDSLRVERAEKAVLLAESRENQYGGIIFDTLPVLGGWIAGPCDSVRHENAVIITPTGQIEARGNIKKAYFNRELFNLQMLEIQHKYDSAISRTQDVKTVVRVEEKFTERIVKRLPWWFWPFVGLVFIAGTYFRNVLNYIIKIWQHWRKD